MPADVSGTVSPYKSPQTLETVVTAFNTVSARQVEGRVDLDVEGATFATYHPDRLMTGYSWDALAMAALLLPREATSVLLLGLGGGTTTRQLRALLPSARLVGVEIDQGVIDLAVRYLHLADQDVEVVRDDAYAYLANTTDRFDVILDDLFLCGPTDVVRTRVPEGDTLRLFRSRLADDGLVAANVITDTGDHRIARAHTRKSFVGAFDCVRVVTPPLGLNEIVVGGASVLSKSGIAPFAERLAAGFDRDQFLAAKVSSPLRASE